MGQKNASETRTTKEVQVDERNNTSALNAPTPGCTTAKASKTSKEYVAATNNELEFPESDYECIMSGCETGRD